MENRNNRQGNNNGNNNNNGGIMNKIGETFENVVDTITGNNENNGQQRDGNGNRNKQ